MDSYYIAAPLSLCSTWAPEVFRFTLNLVLQFSGEEGTKPMPVAIGVGEWESGNGVTKLGWYQWVGSAIFLWGWIHQLRGHAILGRVRAQADDYVIPRGDWFEIVSSPHYLVCRAKQ
ncbi:hypothetical protein V6N11_024999 [Hibiscus sabdariffa]|uniref:3-oxo-5-alpha-steroid 4-dehydrogenase C-terminal domain-containing protein n=1 Tax=Hibiscus sabdariffa TaxID=183260 RepID=A0ABR2QP09_9ROSI